MAVAGSCSAHAIATVVPCIMQVPGKRLSHAICRCTGRIGSLSQACRTGLPRSTNGTDHATILGFYGVTTDDPSGSTPARYGPGRPSRHGGHDCQAQQRKKAAKAAGRNTAKTPQPHHEDHKSTAACAIAVPESSLHARRGFAGTKGGVVAPPDTRFLVVGFSWEVWHGQIFSFDCVAGGRCCSTPD